MEPIRPSSRIEAEDRAFSHARNGSHTAVISLNNTAVTLLSKGFYFEAAATFQDAIGLMRHEAENPNCQNCIKREIRRVLYRAGRRATSTYGKKPPTLQGGVIRNLPQLVCISSQSNPAIVYSALTPSIDRPDLNISFPMTIDPIDFELRTKNDVAFETSIFLYNYGVSYSCLVALKAIPRAASPGQEQPDSIQYQRIYQTFKRAEDFLFQVDEGKMPGILHSSHLLLNTALTHNLLYISTYLNLQQQVNQSRSLMPHLLYLIGKQQTVLPGGLSCVAKAA